VQLWKEISMRYLMRQKLFAWGDDFTIKDANDREVYLVDGKAFTLGKQLSFQDLAGNELVYIKQRLLAWGPTYEIRRGEQVCAVVKKELFTFFRCGFTVDVPGPDDLEAQGELMHHEYEFSRGGRVVAAVSKRWFTWSDTYGVEVADGEDDILILASAVVIDMACHQDQSH
jgi:uncharacterized protein YxjI